ncbi:FHA domain-containing protein [Ramlibacter sp. MMS24-I3-19]|uniref:FHA domain-containing protein n=1 Tax=Ramlibacter sp. MMS24-I3-19 TaxID=3416606 RepID=UPI003D04CA0A
MPSLVVSLAGQPDVSYPIERQCTRIGRSSGNDIVLDSPTVSGTHALLILLGTRLAIEDLGSSNGTFLGSTRIERADLEDGSTFSIGDFVLKLVADPTAMAYEPTMLVRSSAVPRKAYLQRIDGTHPGEPIELPKVVNTIGKPGECIVTFIRRGDDFAVRFSEGPRPLLNGFALADAPVRLSAGDVLETDTGRMQFVLEELAVRAQAPTEMPSAGRARPALGPLSWLRRAFPRTAA